MKSKSYWLLLIPFVCILAINSHFNKKSVRTVASDCDVINLIEKIDVEWDSIIVHKSNGKIIVDTICTDCEVSENINIEQEENSPEPPAIENIELDPNDVNDEQILDWIGSLEPIIYWIDPNVLAANETLPNFEINYNNPTQVFAIDFSEMEGNFNNCHVGFENLNRVFDIKYKKDNKSKRVYFIIDAKGACNYQENSKQKKKTYASELILNNCFKGILKTEHIFNIDVDISDKELVNGDDGEPSPASPIDQSTKNVKANEVFNEQLLFWLQQWKQTIFKIAEKDFSTTMTFPDWEISCDTVITKIYVLDFSEMDGDFDNCFLQLENLPSVLSRSRLQYKIDKKAKKIYFKLHEDLACVDLYKAKEEKRAYKFKVVLNNCFDGMGTTKHDINIKVAKSVNSQEPEADTPVEPQTQNVDLDLDPNDNIERQILDWIEHTKLEPTFIKVKENADATLLTNPKLEINCKKSKSKLFVLDFSGLNQNFSSCNFLVKNDNKKIGMNWRYNNKTEKLYLKLDATNGCYTINDRNQEKGYNLKISFFKCAGDIFPMEYNLIVVLRY